MSEILLIDQVAAAAAYEDLFVPALFKQWAPRLVEAAHIQPGQRILDVACGTGILAREAASQTGASGSVAGLDLTPGMLVVAEQLAPEIKWRQGTAESLPYSEDSFDVVVCQFGLMFFQNREKALREMQRVLVSGGHFAVAVWDSLNSIPAVAEEVDILERRAGPQLLTHSARHLCLETRTSWARSLRRPGWIRP